MVDPVKPPKATASLSKGGNPTARVGTTIKGKWRIDALLGSGGMAAVYAATHRNGQRAALKILHLGLAHDHRSATAFCAKAT